MRRLTAVTQGKQGAQRVVDALIALGVALGDVSMLVVSHGAVDEAEVEHTTLVPQGAVLGSVVGGAVGVGLVAVGWLPGVFAMGPVLAALQVGGGAAGGSLLGALAGLSWWKVEANVPTDLLAADGVLVGVPISDERAELASRAVTSAGALRVYVN